MDGGQINYKDKLLRANDLSFGAYYRSTKLLLLVKTVDDGDVEEQGQKYRYFTMVVWGLTR